MLIAFCLAVENTTDLKPIAQCIASGTPYVIGGILGMGYSATRLLMDMVPQPTLRTTAKRYLYFAQSTVIGAACVGVPCHLTLLGLQSLYSYYSSAYQ